MKCLNSHYSFNSCSDIADTFKCMFPQCDLVQQFSCGERKVSYLCTFGIAPYFADQLLEKVRSSSNYVLLFDETLNKDLQEKQMDIYVCIWDCNRVASYYQSSEFLGHARAVDMLEIFNPVLDTEAFYSYQWMDLQWIGSCTSYFTMTLHTQHLWRC